MFWREVELQTEKGFRLITDETGLQFYITADMNINTNTCVYIECWKRTQQLENGRYSYGIESINMTKA